MVADRDIEIDDRRNPNIITNKSTYLGFISISRSATILESPLPKFPTLFSSLGELI